MGWGRWFLLGDFGQQLELHEQEKRLRALRSQLRSKAAPSGRLEDEVKALRQENEELKLYLLSVIRILMAKGMMSKEEIAAMVEAVDEDDGTKDGRFTGKIDLND